MLRRFHSFRVGLLAAILCVPFASAFNAQADEGPAPVKAKPKPVVVQLASDEEAAEALETFKVEFKARGLRKDDKLSQRDFALQELSKVMHADVVKELGKHTKSSNEIIRILAVIYLGDMYAFPGMAGKYVDQAIKRNKKDKVLLMSGLESLGQLHFLGARKTIISMLKHRDFAVKKCAIHAVGATGDLRLIYDMLKIIGLTLKPGSTGDGESGGSEEAEEGYSWEGVEVTYDTGSPGTGDQEAAERIGKEKQAANEAAAHAANGGGTNPGGSDAGGGGQNTGRGGQARSTEELIRPIKEAMTRLTGQEFGNAGDIKGWMLVNAKGVARRMRHLNKQERKQAKGK